MYRSSLSLFIVVAISLLASQSYQYYYRIKNSSSYVVKELALFSRPFNTLKIDEVSEYQRVLFNENIDNSTLSLTIDSLRISIYVSPSKLKGNYTFIINDIDIINKMIQVEKVKD